MEKKKPEKFDLENETKKCGFGMEINYKKLLLFFC